MNGFFFSEPPVTCKFICPEEIRATSNERLTIILFFVQRIHFKLIFIMTSFNYLFKLKILLHFFLIFYSGPEPPPPLNELYQEIRLTGADKSSPWEGRVEVNVHGEWGTICNKEWDLIDAKVLCRELGYLGVQATGYPEYVECTLC